MSNDCFYVYLYCMIFFKVCINGSYDCNYRAKNKPHIYIYMHVYFEKCDKTCASSLRIDKYGIYSIAVATYANTDSPQIKTNS